MCVEIFTQLTSLALDRKDNESWENAPSKIEADDILIFLIIFQIE